MSVGCQHHSRQREPFGSSGNTAGSAWPALGRATYPSAIDTHGYIESSVGVQPRRRGTSRVAHLPWNTAALPTLRGGSPHRGGR